MNEDAVRNFPAVSRRNPDQVRLRRLTAMTELLLISDFWGRRIMWKLGGVLLLGLGACSPAATSTGQSAADRIEADADAIADNLEMQAANMEASANSLVSGDEDTSTGWTYRETKDEMRGATRKIATIPAKEPLRLPFPYGVTTPELNIRQDPEFGFDIFVTSDGQPICRSYRDDTISMKFDDGPIREWSCAEASDGSPGIIFFNSERSLLGKIKQSENMIVEINYYNAGRQQMTFPVADLEWK